MTDRIELVGIRAHGYHGVFPVERTEGQQYAVDVAFDVDTTTAARTDDLGDTVDYAAVAGLVHAIVGGDPVNLIETLADRIATACLTIDGVVAVDVAVHKPRPPFATGVVDDVVVHVRRSRA